MPERLKVRMMVLAGNHHQAREWMRQNGYRPAECLVIGSEHALRGRSTGGLPREFVGTFPQRRDAQVILDSLAIADLLPWKGGA